MSAAGTPSAATAAHTECRNTAGCVTLVALRSSALPSNIMSVILKPRISLALSMRLRASPQFS